MGEFDDLLPAAKGDPFEDLVPRQSMPKVSLDPYQQYRLSGREPVSGPFGPANPQEVLALPDVLKVPASIIEQSGIPQSLEEVGADFLNRTGINPQTQPGVPLPPARDQETYIPSPLEEAFPNVTKGIESKLREFLTPGTLTALPLLPFKPVQTAFEAQMLSGVPESTESLLQARSPEEAASAGVGLVAGLVGGAGLLRGEGDVRPTTEPTRFRNRLETPIEPEQAPPSVDAGEAKPSAAPVSEAVEPPVAAGGTPQAIPESATPEPVEQPASVTEPVTQEEAIPQGPGARTYRAPQETPESYEGTGLKNAIGEVERASHGLPEATPTERQGMAESWVEAGSILERNPDAERQAVEKLIADPGQSLNGVDAALVLRHKVNIEKQLNDAAERSFTAQESSQKLEALAEHARLSDHLLQVLDAVKATGTESGRALRWRQAIAKEDYSFASMERQLRVSKGGERLNDSEFANLKAQHDLIQTKLAAAEEATLAAQVDAAMARARAAASTKPVYHPKIIETAKKIVGKLDQRADLARARLKEKFARTSAGIDPTILKDVAEIGASHLAHNIVDFAEWSDKLVREFGEAVKPYLEKAFELAKQSIDKIDVPAPVKKVLIERLPDEQKQSIRDAIQKKLDSGNKDVAFYVQKLARLLYEEGVRGRDELIKALHSELQKIIPDITERQTADAFSGYGDFRQLSKDDITIALRGMKGELQQIAKLEDMQAGQPPLKSGLERRTPTDAERELIKKVNEAKFKFQVPISDPTTQLKSALDTLKTTLENRIKDYEKRLAEKDFAPKVRRELVLDRDAMRLKADAERAKSNFQRALEANRLANRATWQKALSKFVKVERFFKLSSPAVFGKLLGAAFARAITTATEEAAGGALGKLPGISRVAKQAPREGGFNVKAMAQGLSDALSREAIRQSRKKATTGETDIETLYSKKGLRDPDWTNLMGQLHGALKTPVMLGEFRLSLEKRLESAITKGVGVSSPEVLTRIQSEAMDDAYRSIFMQRGFTSDLFNNALSMAEKSKKYPVAGEVFARAARFLMPVVRVPLNIVGETATGVAGAPVASTRVMFHAIKGTLDTLDPKTADSIMRQFKKGSIGLGLMAIGYYNPQSIGGFDYREKRKPGAVKTAGFQIGGHDIPRWATHAPWFELMQIGTTIRHVQDQHTKTGTKGISEGMWAAAWGLVEQTPFFDQMTRWARASESAPARTRLLGTLAEGTLVPQAVSQAAAVMGPEKVKPTTVADYVKSGIPGLRGTINQDSPYK